MHVHTTRVWGGPLGLSINFYGLAIVLFEHLLEEYFTSALELGFKRVVRQLHPTEVKKVGFGIATYPQPLCPMVPRILVLRGELVQYFRPPV